MPVPAQRFEPGEMPHLGPADLANRPVPEWQGPAPLIPHGHADYLGLAAPECLPLVSVIGDDG